MIFRPPHRSPKNQSSKFNSDFYNLTMTYKIDSDIFFGYGQTFERSSGKRISPARNIQWRKPNDDFKGS